MPALPPKADLLGRHEKRLLMTQSGHWPHGVAFAISANSRRLFDLTESVALLGFTPQDDYDEFAASLYEEGSL